MVFFLFLFQKHFRSMKKQITYCVFGFEGTGFPIAERLVQEDKHVLTGQVSNKTSTLVKSGHIDIENQLDKNLRMRRYDYILDKTDANKLVERLKKVKDPQNYFLFFESNNLFYFAEQLKDLGFMGNF